MPASAYVQTSFLGGEWGPLSQGRSDLPTYHQAMNVCLNGIVVEEGAWVRRSGFQFISTTRGRLHAKLLPYTPDISLPYTLEFTNLSMRVYTGTSPVFTAARPGVTASSFSGGFLSLTVDSLGVPAVAVGDDVMIYAPFGVDNASIGPFRNRVLRVTNISSLTLTLGDDTGAAISGVTSGANELNTCTVMVLYRFVTVWTGTSVLDTLRIVQAPAQVSQQESGYILSSSAFPYIVTFVTLPAGDVDATFSLGVASFLDGPFQDPQGTIAAPETGSVSGYSGSITFTPATTTFTASDVGRQIRLLSEPAAWASGTTYTYGQTVKYGGGYWTSLAMGTYATSNVGITPGTLATISGIQVYLWAPAPNAAQWAWGTITAQAGTSCTVSLVTNLLAANGATIPTWRLGVFTAGQYPQVGLYHGGRLWLAGAIPNRFDGSMANGINENGSVQFSPTDINGVVNDDHGISRIIAGKENSNIMWMVADHSGMLMGTLTCEYLVSSLSGADGVTPTDIQAKEVTKYQCAFTEPVRAGMALIFVQRYARRVLEYLSDAFSGRFNARHLNENAKHLTTAGVAEIAYQEETVPIVWCRMYDGTLAGCTYRRVSRFMTEAPVVEAWHRHNPGGDYANDLQRLVTSICVQPSATTVTLADNLYVTTSDATGGANFIEVLRPLLEDV